MPWALCAQWALPLSAASALFGVDADDLVSEALHVAPACLLRDRAVAFLHMGVRAFALLPRGGGQSPTSVLLSRDWGGGALALMTSLACVEDVLLVGGSCGSVALFSLADLDVAAACGDAGGGGGCGSGGTVAPRLVIAPEAGAPAAGVVGFACSVARRGAPGGFAPHALYVALDCRELLRCEWAPLRACLDGGGGAAATPPFTRRVLGGSPRAVAAVAAANPIVGDLFFAPSAPEACFLNAGGGNDGEGRDAILASGQGPPLAAYHCALSETGDSGSLSSLLGDALKHSLAGLSGGWLGGLMGGNAEELEEAEGGEEEEDGENEDAGGAGNAARAPLRLRPRAAPRATLLPECTLSDAERRVEALFLDPTGRFLLSTDSWGRVALVECGELTVERLWKGYRGGAAGWAVGHAPGGRAGLFALLHAPRRGLLEVWRAVNGERAACLKVARASRLLYGAPPPPPAAVGGASFPPPLSLLISCENGALAAHALLQQH
jgi:hypothetical protein